MKPTRRSFLQSLSLSPFLLLFGFSKSHAASVEVVYPEWFGAKADGVTDDTAAIQAAIDYISSKGGIVQLPSGSVISNTITLK